MSSAPLLLAALLLAPACDYSAATLVTNPWGADTADTATDTGDSTLVDTAGDSGGGDSGTDSGADSGSGTGDDADGDGWSSTEGDCDDGDPTRHPGAADDCDGVDDDCDGTIDEGALDDDPYEPNDPTPFDLGSLEDDPARALAALFVNDDDVDRYAFTIVDDLTDFFTVTATVSNLPSGTQVRFALERLRSDGGEPLGVVTETTGTGTLTLSFADESFSEDGGDYAIVLTPLSGADCSRTYLLAVSQ